MHRTLDLHRKKHFLITNVWIIMTLEVNADKQELKVAAVKG